MALDKESAVDNPTSTQVENKTSFFFFIRKSFVFAQIRPNNVETLIFSLWAESVIRSDLQTCQTSPIVMLLGLILSFRMSLLSMDEAIASV